MRWIIPIFRPSKRPREARDQAGHPAARAAWPWSTSGALAWFLLKELFRSWIALAPLAITVSLYWLFFEYPGDTDYFAATGGFTLSLVSLIATLVIAAQVNRSTSYVVVGRLARRSALLGAIVVCALAVTALMAALYTGLALAQGKIAADASASSGLVEALLILPRWLMLGWFSACLGLLVSTLTSWHGSHLFVLIVLALVATITEQRGRILATRFDFIATATGVLVAPFTINLADPVLPASLVRYFGALLAALLYGMLLFLAAAWLFSRKDLLWVEGGGS